MKITPLEIRQKSFEKGFRGYDKDEVNAYLGTLSQEWEKLQDEIKELRLNVKNAEREVEKLRQVESSLYKTLKTAEDTGANMIDQASKAAELALKESQMNAEAMLSDAKKQARDMIEEADQRSRMIMDQMESEIKNLQQAYKVMANSYDNMLNDMKNLANDTAQRVEKGRAVQSTHHIDKIVEKALGYNKGKMDAKPRTIEWEPKDSKESNQMVSEETPKDNTEKSESFFDQIE
jgi:cell division initiation protein